MSHLDIKKELAKLSKSELIELLCGLSMGRLPSTYETASIVRQALTAHARANFERYDKKTPITFETIKVRGSLNDEYFRVCCNLDTGEIERQLIALYNEASKQRDQKRQADRARVSRDFEEYKSRVMA